MWIPTHTGVVCYPKKYCKLDKVSVVWNLIEVANYWVSESGIHFHKVTGIAMSDRHLHVLDLKTIEKVGVCPDTRRQ